MVHSFASADRILTHGEAGQTNLILSLASALLQRVSETQESQQKLTDLQADKNAQMLFASTSKGGTEQ